jgi:hypothetical protein
VAGRVDREQHVRRDREQDAERQAAADEPLERRGAHGIAHDEGAHEGDEDERHEGASVLGDHGVRSGVREGGG